MTISRAATTGAAVLFVSLLVVFNAGGDDVHWTGLANDNNDNFSEITNWGPSSATFPFDNDNVTIDDITPKATVVVDVEYKTQTCSLFLGDGHVLKLKAILEVKQLDDTEGIVRTGGTVVQGDVTFKGTSRLETFVLRIYHESEDTVISYDGNPSNSAVYLTTVIPTGTCP